MTKQMSAQAGDSIPTRPSLLNRLKGGDHPESWQEFYDTYGGLIRAFSIKPGLAPSRQAGRHPSAARPYLTKHRVTALVTQEIRKLEKR